MTPDWRHMEPPYGSSGSCDYHWPGLSWAHLQYKHPPGFSENIILLFGVLQQVFVVFDIFLTFDYWLKDVEVVHAILVRDTKQTNPRNLGNGDIWSRTWQVKKYFTISWYFQV